MLQGSASSQGHSDGVTTPICAELNAALGQAEAEVLHEGGDPVSLLNQVQGELGARLREAAAGSGGP
jgi:hypothetical protein